jgi:cytochrome c553
MKTVKTLAFALSAVLPLSAMAAGDPEAGKTKANMCMICHGSADFGGIFLQLQLAGRNADKLATKTNKYRNLKTLHPMMNLWAIGLSDKDVEDISAYYEKLGKPAIIVPGIRGDEDEDTKKP